MSTNHPFYDAAMDAARLLGNNLGTAAKNKRTMCIELVRAAVVEGFDLNKAIGDAKGKLGWSKLEKSMTNLLQKDFGYVRFIAAGWSGLTAEAQAAFLAGEKTPSTLAKEMKEAEKQAMEEAEKAGEEVDAEDAADDTPAERELVETGGAKEAGPSEIFTMAEMIGKVATFIRHAKEFSDEEAGQLADLLTAVREWEAEAEAQTEREAA